MNDCVYFLDFKVHLETLLEGLAVAEVYQKVYFAKVALWKEVDDRTYIQEDLSLMVNLNKIVISKTTPKEMIRTLGFSECFSENSSQDLWMHKLHWFSELSVFDSNFNAYHTLILR